MRCVTTTRRPLAVMPVMGNEAGNLRRHTASKNNYSRPCRKKQSRFGTLKGPLQLFHRFFWPKSGVKLKPSHDQRHQLSSVHRDKDLVVVHPLTHSGSRGLPGVQCDPVTPPMESRRDPPLFAMTGEGSADTVVCTSRSPRRPHAHFPFINLWSPPKSTRTHLSPQGSRHAGSRNRPVPETPAHHG
jgi:hypothetical protein